MSNLKKRAKTESNSIIGCRTIATEIKKVVTGGIRVAILSNYTVKGLAECLITKAYVHDVFLDVYEGAYDQWRQEIFGNRLYDFNPDIIFLFIDLHGPEQDEFFSHHYRSNKEMDAICSKIKDELGQYLHQLKEKTKAKIIVTTAVKIWPPVVGIFDNKMSFGWYQVIDDFNHFLINNYKDDKQVFVFNFNEWLGHIGKNQFWQDKYTLLADMRLSPLAMPALADELMAYMVPLSSKKKKCLVLDLDNTLWGGIIGEDGLAGIRLAPTGEGQPFYLFQKLLLSLKHRGVLLAINSKNNEPDALEVIKNHPHMILRADDFIAWRINWDNKASNLKSLAEELNIGLDSLVFVDDDLTNRLLVEEALPEVTVLDLPSDATKYVRTLLDFKGFNSFEYTKEDTKRSEMYLEEKKRKEYKTKVIDLDSFVEGLGLRLAIKPIDHVSLPRSAQLTQKTNQFNLTTQRYHEDDLEDFIKEGARLWTLEVTDRFGEYGMTGLCVVKDLRDQWEVDTLLLSCRILGRKIEDYFFGYILELLKNSKPKKIRAIYRPTSKNAQVRDFYQRFGFKKISFSDQEDVWERDLSDYQFTIPNFIKINN